MGDYTNALRNLNKLSVFGVAKYEEKNQFNQGKSEDDGLSVAECMKMEDEEYLEYILTQNPSIEIYTKMGYEPRIQNTIKRIQWFIDQKQELHNVSIEEMKELIESLKNRSVVMYD